MIMFKNTFLFLLFSSCLLAQENNPGRVTGKNLLHETVSASHITSSSSADSAFIKVEMQKAHYDPDKKNLPYYLVSHPGDYNQTASPTLIIKKTQLVTEPHASVVKKFLGQFLTRNFEIKAVASLSAGKNLNLHRIYPFRLNDQSQVEELIDYDLTWAVSANSNRSALSQSATFTTSSVLASGTWYKIALAQNGIYKLDKNFLNSIGINTGAIDPRKIRIFGNGGKTIPELNMAFRYDDLQENAIQVIGESDGVFDNGDYVLFYGTGVDYWKKTATSGIKYSREKNYYSDTSYYFINVDLVNGKRVQSKPSPASSPNMFTSTYDYYNFHEIDQVNFIKSGRQFFGEYFDLTTSYTFPFNEGNFVAGDSIFAEVSAAGRSLSNTLFQVTGNGLNGTFTTSGVNINFYLDPYADAQTATFKGLNNNSSAINITVTKLSATSIGWMDKLTVFTRRNLVVDRQFQFRDSKVTGTGNVCGYTLANPNNYTFTLWDVTDPLNPTSPAILTSGSSITFNSAADSLMEFAVAPSNGFYTPFFAGKVANQNLHAIAQADYVIVTHPLFTNAAQRVATLHQQQEGLTYAIVTTEQIFNEFGSGMPDASAIRDFVRMLYTRNLTAGKQPKYLLLLGDGSFDNKTRNLSINSNLIPTYETSQSINVLSSTATDDFYALMDPSEGYLAEGPGGALDIGVGRFTCRTVAEANAIATKIENYYKKDNDFHIADSNIENCTATNESHLGDWRNWVIFMADDKDAAEHMREANTLANTVQLAQPQLNIDKVYLDAYRRFSTPGGERYPDAAADMNKRIKRGALVFNYTGHGGEVGLTEERVLDVETINAWDNFNKLPLFITATCEFSRYDDPARTSAGEYCLLNPNGASIGLLTTCRVAFSTTNLILNTVLFDYIFKKLPDGSKPALGDIIRETKANLGQSIYYANFHLLGDPALKLAYPEQKVLTTKISTHTVSPTSSDTLSALSKITISGFVADTLGNKLTGFNGIVYPTVFDKVTDVVCLLNDPASYDGALGVPFKFKLQKNILYKGKAEVKNGDFTFSFMVPKDISFAYGPGKISYYATNGQTDAGGNFQQVVVGGGSKNPVTDNDGPQVNLFLNDKNFVNGGTTNEKPILYANLTDSSGINTLGTGIGHDISVVLDQNTTKPVILNDYYEAALNSYQSGRVRYPFDQLSEGNHRITFKAWDIQNNSNIVSTDFVVAPSAELALTHVLNYPNPFTSSTKFFLEHNQACNPLKVTVQIFTISGKVVKTLQRSVTCEGFRPEGIEWDGKDDFGDKLGRGVYIYKVSIITGENKKAEKTEKLVILN